VKPENIDIPFLEEQPEHDAHRHRLTVEVVLRLHYIVRVQCPQLFDGWQVLGLHHRFKLADVVGVSDNEFDGVHTALGSRRTSWG
jgi:hypothetical protein